MIKHDWKKDEKEFYCPKAVPQLLNVPAFTYLSIKGSGAPSSPGFQKAIETLFSLAYGLKFAPRKGLVIEGYEEYAVYPLEGLWDLSEAAKMKSTWEKDDFVYTLMIRQPDFIKTGHVESVKTGLSKKGLLLDQVSLETIADGECAQIMHLGSFDSEPESFAILDAFIQEKGRERRFKAHKEIYLSDFTKTKSKNLKTILRIYL